MQPLHAADADHVRACASHARAHGVEEVGQVDDVGLLGGVVDHRGALGLGSGHHHIDGAAHRDQVKKHVAADETAVRPGIHHAAAVLDIGAQGSKALQVLVDGTAADGASAGIAHLGTGTAAKQRAQQIVAGTQALGVGIGHMTFVHAVRIDDQVLSGNILGFGTQQIEDLDQGVHVVDIRQVFHRAGLVAQKRRRDDGHSGILAAADRDLAHQGTSAGNQHFILAHKSSPKAGSHLASRDLMKAVNSTPSCIIHAFAKLGKTEGFGQTHTRYKCASFLDFPLLRGVSYKMRRY